MAPAVENGVRSQRRRPEGPATVLALGTAVPPFVHEQSTYPDYYFEETKCSHKTELKAKFKRICDKMQIDKRHMVVRKELLELYPSIASFMDTSMSERREILMEWIPKMAVEAATNAVRYWGEDKQSITHVIMATTSVVNMPRKDLILANALGLSSRKLRRVMMYQTGCWGGAALLRVAKDIAENNLGARVLVLCSECTTSFFRAPSEDYLDGLLGQGLFGDGCGHRGCRSAPIRASTLRDSLVGNDGGAGQYGRHRWAPHGSWPVLPSVAGHYAPGVREFVTDAREQAENTECNDLFWAVHAGGAPILDQIENELELTPEKLRASRDILRDFGNMSSACALFVLDRIRQRSKEDKTSTTGEGKEFGLLIGLGPGPGLPMECSVLKAVPLAFKNSIDNSFPNTSLMVSVT